MEVRARSAVGRRTGRFVLETLIEDHGYRAVYRARKADAPGDRPVAVKLLRTEAPGPEVVRAFEEERRCLDALSHPAIPRLLEWGTTSEGWPWFATEFAPGYPLIRYAADHGLGLAQRIRLMIEMCRAVEHAHVRGVLHRDLDPESLTVTTRGEPLVVGLGVEGTNTAENVRALGWILYELLNPVRPYLTVLRGGGPPRTGLLPRSRPRPRSGIDHLCLEAIGAGDREGYRTASALADDLSRVLQGNPLAARRLGATSRLRRWMTRIWRRGGLPGATVARYGTNT